MTPASSQRGFTLVEMMIALLIFGMIAAAGVALLSFSIRAQATTAARLDNAGAVARLSSLMTADLAQALDRPSRDERGLLLPAFGGDATSLRLVRGGWDNLDEAPRPSAQKVEYRLNAGVLERITYPMLDGAAPLTPMAALSDVTALTLRYRFEGAWSDHWDGSGGAPLPQAVELSVTRRDGTTIRQMFLVGTGDAPPLTASDNNAS